MHSIVFLIGLTVVLAAPTDIGKKTSTLPVCLAEESCLGTKCGCCGQCDEDTEYRCKPSNGKDCQNTEIRTEVAYSMTKKMTKKEREDGSQFFARAMQFTNDSSWNWDAMNPEKRRR